MRPNRFRDGPGSDANPLVKRQTQTQIPPAIDCPIFVASTAQVGTPILRFCEGQTKTQVQLEIGRRIIVADDRAWYLITASAKEPKTQRERESLYISSRPLVDGK